MSSAPPAASDRLARSLRERLAAALPGETVMAAMAPSGRAFVPESVALADGADRAAALVLLYPAPSGSVCVALTARAPDLRHHAGQVSLPGGRVEPGEDIVAAALREAHEELAVAAAEIEVLGRLTPLYVAPSHFVVYPVVAVAPRRPSFAPDPAEVAALVEAPLAWLADDAHRRVEWRIVAGARRRVPCYVVGETEVWGATAMVLAELARVWEESGAGAMDAAAT